MRYSELKIMLRKQGCSMIRQGANHEIWKSPNGKLFPVARHDNQEVPSGTLKSIKKDAWLE